MIYRLLEEFYWLADFIQRSYREKGMISKGISWKITAAQICKFAETVGDYNPVHSDPIFAAKTRFKTPIAHGMFALILLNHTLPHEYQIKSMQIRFLRPIYPEYLLSGVLHVKGGQEFQFSLVRDGEQLTMIRGELERSCQ